MRLDNLVKDISTVIQTVFDNEEKFLKDFYPVDEGYELHEFYIGSGRCRLVILSWGGMTFSDTVKTQDVFDWVEALSV